MRQIVRGNKQTSSHKFSVKSILFFSFHLRITLPYNLYSSFPFKIFLSIRFFIMSSGISRTENLRSRFHCDWNSTPRAKKMTMYFYLFIYSFTVSKAFNTLYFIAFSTAEFKYTWSLISIPPYLMLVWCWTGTNLTSTLPDNLTLSSLQLSTDICSHLSWALHSQSIFLLLVTVTRSNEIRELWRIKFSFLQPPGPFSRTQILSSAPCS
jgi:hypothetical protein